MIVIGITGTIGAGKDTVAEYLMNKHDFVHYSLSDILRDKAAARGFEATRDNLAQIGNEIRTQHGTGELARRLVEKVNQAGDERVILTSIRTPGEVSILKKAWPRLYMLAVDAPIELRYERISKRGKRADEVSFEQFKAQELREFATDGPGQQLGKTIDLADKTVNNDSSLDDLYKQVDEIISALL